MEIVFVVLLAGVIPGFLLMLATLWAIWMAMGRTSVAIRVPVFLAGTVPIGLIPSVLSGNDEVTAYCVAWLALAILSAAAGGGKYLVMSIVFLIIASVHGFVIFLNGAFHPEWLTTTTIALCLLSGLISLLRLLGYRLVRFTADAISQEIRAASGRDVDEWIEILDSQDAKSWKYADIIIFLRDYGIDYRWQKAIAIAYEKTLGRRTIEESFDGKPMQIQSSLGWTLPHWFGHLGQQRFSIVQIMIWSLAAATLLAYFRLTGHFAITTAQVVTGFPLVLAMAVVAWASMQSCLGVRNRVPRVVSWAFLIAAIFSVPSAVNFLPRFLPVYLVMASAMAGYVLWMFGALHLVRQHGFRLVRLQPG